MEKKRDANNHRQRTPNPVIPVLLISIGFILVLVFAFLMLTNNNRQIVDQDQIPRVSADEARKALENGDAFFLDVRVPEAYAASHVTGAVNIPVAELENQIDRLDPQQWIITYCTWPNENSSARAALILLNRGFKKVNPIEGGFEAWVDAGLPVEP